MKRRDFLLLSASALALAPIGEGSINAAATTPESVGDVAARLLTSGLRSSPPLGLVWLKTTFGWARRCGAAANANPQVVRRVCDTLLDLGAKRVLIVDRFYQSRKYAEQVNGFRGIARGGSIAVAALPCGDQTDTDRELLAAMPDSLICIEPAKHHARWGFSGIAHPARLLPADLATRFRGGILDATRVLQSGGPEGGGSDVIDVGSVAFGRDAARLDDWGVHATGLQRRRG